MVLSRIDSSLIDGIQFGGQSANRRGTANWDQNSLEVITRESLSNWFENDGELWQPEEKLEPAPVPTGTNNQVRIEVELQFDRWFMVRDPSHAKSKNNKDDHSDVDAIPLMSIDGKILLPIRGFKGAFRSHLEKIARTIDSEIGGDPVRDNTFGVVEILFGAAGDVQCKGAVECSDFLDAKIAQQLEMGATPNSNSTPLNFTPLIRREFVAIDRFTGGAADSFKFSALPAWRPRLSGTLSINMQRLESNAAIYNKLHGVYDEDQEPLQAALGLLVLTLNDLRDGEITFGMGSSKGFGTNQGSLDCEKAFKDKFPSYVQSLFNHIGLRQTDDSKEEIHA